MTALPRWRRVLAVVAHPDDESFALGALLDRFVTAGAEVSVLCLTHGEASNFVTPMDNNDNQVVKKMKPAEGDNATFKVRGMSVSTSFIRFTSLRVFHRDFNPAEGRSEDGETHRRITSSKMRGPFT